MAAAVVAMVSSAAGAVLERFGFGVRLGAGGEQKQSGRQEPKRSGAEVHYIVVYVKDSRRQETKLADEAASYGRALALGDWHGRAVRMARKYTSSPTPKVASP